MTTQQPEVVKPPQDPTPATEEAAQEEVKPINGIAPPDEPGETVVETPVPTVLKPEADHVAEEKLISPKEKKNRQ